MSLTCFYFESMAHALKRLRIATPEQKQLLAIVDSTRPQSVTQRYLRARGKNNPVAGANPGGVRFFHATPFY
ncbi:MAG: hypothetical protein AB9869_32970 [Verrucomicrobiia bacterium]